MKQFKCNLKLLSTYHCALQLPQQAKRKRSVLRRPLTDLQVVQKEKFWGNHWSIIIIFIDDTKDQLIQYSVSKSNQTAAQQSRMWKWYAVSKFFSQPLVFQDILFLYVEVQFWPPWWIAVLLPISRRRNSSREISSLSLPERIFKTAELKRTLLWLHPSAREPKGCRDVWVWAVVVHYCCLL